MLDLANFRVGSLRYNSPSTQVVVLGLVVFCTVGMFSTTGYLGAGGAQDVQLVDIANSVLYATFALGGLVAGSFTNLLGVRLTLFIGTLGYAVYVSGLWVFQTHAIRWYLILTGGILGLCAALLWSAQGALIMSLPMEKDKGRAFSVFWILFQSGALMGSLIALGTTVNNGEAATIGTGLYLAFIIIMLIGSALTWCILPPAKVIRQDGTIVQIEAAISVREELRGMIATFKLWQVWLLLPAFVASNYFYAYQGAITAAIFNGRTRSLVAVISSIGSMSGALVMGFVLDKSPFKTRRLRGFVGVTLCIFACIAIWGCGLAYQLGFTRASKSKNLDWSDSQSSKPLALIFFFYWFDAAFQSLIYYIMGALSNSPYQLARFAGVYKAVQSAGAAGSFGMDATVTPYLTELLASALLCLVSLPLMYIILNKVTDTPIEEMTTVDEVVLDGKVAVPKGHMTHADEKAEYA